MGSILGLPGSQLKLAFHSNSHESDAIAVSLKDFKGIFFERILSPRWLKGAQEEMKHNQESDLKLSSIHQKA
ncbi:MAG: hypothetical protein WC894_04445 [Patescibacteria group bacterium]